eukprot:gene15255-15403_t
MSDSLLPYYNRELVAIRKLAAEFAEANPKIAGRLRLAADAVDDPHVARLLDGTAFLAARVHHRLDDEFPEFTDALLGLLYPQFLSPVPACAIAQLTCAADLTAPLHVPAGLAMDSEPVRGEPCRFRTSSPVTLWPIEIEAARLSGLPLAAPPNSLAQGAQSVLRLTLRCASPDATFTSLGVDQLRLFLRAPGNVSMPLYELLCGHTLSVAYADGPVDQSAVLMGADALSPGGFGPDEALFPWPARGFSGFRLLSEYFALPEKFLFIDLNKVNAKTLASAGRRMDVFVYLDRAVPELERSLNAETFALGCVPIVNLFTQRCEPVPLSHEDTEYRVVPDSRRPGTMEVWSIERVRETRQDGSHRPWRPFYRLSEQSTRQPEEGSGYYHIIRRPSPAPLRGSELLLAPFDPDFDPEADAAGSVLSIDALCTNRDLATELPFGGGHPRMKLSEGMATITRIACLTAPTAPLRLRAREQTFWRLISHLSIGHLSLVGGAEGAAALKEALRLYDWRDSAETRAAVEGLIGVSSRPGAARVPGSRAGAFCRGLDVTLEFEQRAWEVGGLYLLASVLDRFLALHATRPRGGLAGTGRRARSAVTEISLDSLVEAEAPKPASRRKANSAMAMLLRKPQRYRFDAAVRVLAHVAETGDAADAVRFRAPVGTAYPGPEVLAVQEGGTGMPRMTTPVMALTGPTGVLPRHYTEILHTTVRNRSPALQDFTELLAQRFVAQFARAGTKYRPHRIREAAHLNQKANLRGGHPETPDPLTQSLLAFAGFATPHLVPRVAAGAEPLLHYAGLLSMRPHSAERLQAMLSDWLGRKVEVLQFVGDWLSLPPDQRTRMPRGRAAGAYNRLGYDAAIGVRAWDIQARIVLRIGPLDGEGFAALLPDRPLLRQLVSLTRAFLGFETGFAVNPVLQAQAVPKLRLEGGAFTPAPPTRLGWNTWIPKAGFRTDAADAVFAAELVEAEEECMMSVWGAGYVTDIAYKPGYYPDQSPWHLALCASIVGAKIDFPYPDDPFSYLELGCGQGLGAILLAGANPHWRVTAIDFNPAHIVSARKMAAAAGLTNVTFLEADLSTLCDEPDFALVPEADMVSMHGVWSWVAPEVRQGILRLLKARVRAGGLVHVSYNALPTWQGAIGLQRLVRQAGLRQKVRSDRQAQAGLELARELAAVNADNLVNQKVTNDTLELFKVMPDTYLAHELMNSSWQPCFHADVAEAMSEAKLDWVGSAHLRDNFPTLVLTEPQRAIVDRYDDPMMTELLKDTCISRGLRSDIFIRGVNKMSAGARDATLGALSIGLKVRPAEFRYQIELPIGTVGMNEPFYGAIVAALANGPMRLDRLGAQPGLEGKPCSPVEVAGMMLGCEQAELVPCPGAALSEQALRTNRMVVETQVDVEKLGWNTALVSNRLGGGVRCPAIEAFVIGQLAEAPGSGPDDWATAMDPSLPAEDHAKLREMMTRIDSERRPVWELAGYA